MAKTLYIAIIFLFCRLELSAQNIDANQATLPKSLLQFIPEGYTFLDIAKGYLNFDKFEDIVLVLKKVGEDTAFDATEYKRPLLLLLGHSNKTFTLAARNDNVVYCFKCGGAFGEPYDGVEINNGTFRVNHFGGTNDRWSNAILFKYSGVNKTWYLYRIIDKGWSVFHLDKVGTSIRTKKDFGTVTFTNYTDDN